MEAEEEKDGGDWGGAGARGGRRQAAAAAALVGACRVVERDYTRTVEPHEVRPVPVLEEVRCGSDY
jgi:hypothetical protein